jgi:hypothetical protein
MKGVQGNVILWDLIILYRNKKKNETQGIMENKYGYKSDYSRCSTILMFGNYFNKLDLR